MEEDGIRIMLDNGKCFSNEHQFYKDFLKPRINNNLRDYLRLGLVPEIPGIYAKSCIQDTCIEDFDDKSKYLAEWDLCSYEEYIEENGQPYIQGLFLSHAHLDHMYNILFMHPEIPIYCSEETKKLMEIISDLSDDDFRKYCFAVKNKYSRGYFPGSIKKNKCYEERDIRIIEPYKSLHIPSGKNTFNIKSFPIDHSLPGAMAFEITTKNGKKIIYTGDIRFHGLENEKEKSDYFLNNVIKDPDVLITEGTRIDDENEFGEEDVFKSVTNYLKGDDNLSEKLIMTSFPWKCLSRFLTVYDIALKLKRTLIVQPKLAYLLHHMQELKSLRIENILQNENIKIYLPRKNSMTYSKGDYVNTKIQISYTTDWSYEQIPLYEDAYGKEILIKAPEIKEHPSKYLIHLSFYDLNELIDISPPKGSFFFNLKTEPFDEEGEIEREILKNWMDRFQLNFIEGCHASGHASAIQLKNMIKKLNPKIIFPIHTEKPELFKFENTLSEIFIGHKYEI